MTSEQPHSAEKLDAMMRKIKNLIARADHPNTPEAEADTAREMAEKLMIKYRIDESTLIESGALVGELFKPGLRVMDIGFSNSEYITTYRNIMAYIVDHVGARMVYGFEVRDGQRAMIAKVVGYEADLRFAEVLFMHAKVFFESRMEPKPDPTLSDQENVYRMRNAGMERIRIASIMGWTKGGAKVTRLYKAACIEKGEDPDAMTGKGNNVKVFREMYAESFQTQLWSNLFRARNAADQAEGGLVLVGRKEKVDEAFYQEYPHLRPVPVERGIGEEPTRRAAREYKQSKADADKQARRYTKAGQAGMRAGAKAADSVNVKGVKAANRLEN